MLWAASTDGPFGRVRGRITAARVAEDRSAHWGNSCRPKRKPNHRGSVGGGEGGGFQDDGGTEDACRAHENGEPAGAKAIRDAQAGRTLVPAIEDKQLMPDQRGLGNHGTESPRPAIRSVATIT